MASARDHREAREYREKVIAERYLKINKDLGLGKNESEIREHARKEATDAARRASNDDK